MTETLVGPFARPAPPAGTAERLLLADVRLALGGPADPVHAAPAEPLAGHLDRVGPRPAGTRDVVALLEDSGLTGHGGAHVPAALKWRAALAGTGQLTVVANGAESEPLAGKDGTLLRQRPHLVLDGLQVAAEALGAERAVVWLHGDDHGSLHALRRALAERAASTHGTTRGPAVELVTGPVHYLAGESSAITRAVLGGPALPTARRPAAPGAPRTLVHNVETLARLALLVRGRAAAGTRLLTVVGDLRVVVEVDERTTVTQLLADLGRSAAPQAVLLGGYGGLWASWDRVARVPVGEAAMRAEGLSLGAGVLAPLAAGACGVRQTAAVVAYLASMSARQCGPCLFGLPALAGSLARLADGARGSAAGVLDDAAAVEGRGACHHPDGAARLAASAAVTFADDLAAHAAGRPCGGGVVPWPEVDR